MAIPLTRTCVPSGQDPQPRTRAFIESQATQFHLRLQSIRVCRSTSIGPAAQSERDFANVSFSAEVRDRWLPAYIGCCTYAFRRHFAIVVEEPAVDGPMLIVATLIQSRWDYMKWLRSHCDQKLKAWL